VMVLVQQERMGTTGWVIAQLPDIVAINPRATTDIDEDLEVSFVPMQAVEAMSGRVDLELSIVVQSQTQGNDIRVAMPLARLCSTVPAFSKAVVHR
jgi:hypothetical protein